MCNLRLVTVFTDSNRYSNIIIDALDAASIWCLFTTYNLKDLKSPSLLCTSKLVKADYPIRGIDSNRCWQETTTKANTLKARTLGEKYEYI